MTDNKDRSIEDGDNNEGNETEEYEEIESPKVKALNSQLEDLQRFTSLTKRRLAKQLEDYPLL